ncbi:hypothetical protein LBA_00011 [Megavirus lba]|uniref:Uncharacterized protein n=1 Tax=Megavirus lba TaxID=1235314 RepID=L7Y2G2_9VIRU|nr:hypothetical protein LBA_00011 [Megavirus lba]
MQQKIGYKPVNCHKPFMNPIMRFIAVVEIPDNIEIIIPHESIRISEREADEFIVKRIELIDGDIVPLKFLELYKCFDSKYKQYYPTAHIKKDFNKGIQFFLDKKDIKGVDELPELEKQSINNLYKLKQYVSECKIYTHHFSKNKYKEYTDDEIKVFKKIELECKSYLDLIDMIIDKK